MKSDLRPEGGWKGLGSRLLQWPFGIFSLILLYLAWRVVDDELPFAVSLGALALIASAAVFMVLSRQDLTRIIRRLEKIGPVGFTADDADIAAEGLGVSGEGDELLEEGEDLEFDQTKLGLRLELEMKMSSLARRVFGVPSESFVDPSTAGYVTIGSLADSQYISRQQARLAAVILTWTDGKRKPPSEGGLRKNVQKFVDKFRIIVFAAVVQDVVSERGEFRASKVGREDERDLEVYAPGARNLVRLIPAYTLKKRGKVVKRITKRLVKDEQDMDCCAIVVPNGSKAIRTNEKPIVIELRELSEDWLKEKAGL